MAKAIPLTDEINKIAPNRPRLGRLKLAEELEAAGAFAIMLECVPKELAAVMTSKLKIPVFGIGAGPDCDGQILVPQDMLGLFERFVPKFVKVYRNLSEEIKSVFHEFAEDVSAGRFPAETHSYVMEEEERKKFRGGI